MRLFPPFFLFVHVSLRGSAEQGDGAEHRGIMDSYLAELIALVVMGVVIVVVDCKWRRR